MPVPVDAVASAVDGKIGFEHLPAPLGEHALNAAGERLIAMLEQGSSRQRAAAALFGFSDVRTREDLEVWLQRVVHIARDDNDPIVLGWALSVCDAYRPEACGQPLARRWIAAEPDNAAAWLALAKRAGVDLEEVDRGIAQSTRYSVHAGAVAETVRTAWPVSEPPYLLALLLMASLNVDHLFSSSPTLTVFGHCKLPRPDGALRTRACSALAETLTERAVSVNDLLLGTALRQWAGWPADRVAEVRARYDSSVAQLVALGPENAPQPLACKEVERLHDWVRSVGTNGELSSLRTLNRGDPAANAVSRAPSTDRSPAASKP